MKHAGAVLKADICENTVPSNRACSVVNQERLFGSGSSHRNHSHEPWHSFSWKHHFWLQTSSSRPSASFEGTLSLVCLTLAQATSLSRHFFFFGWCISSSPRRRGQTRPAWDFLPLGSFPRLLSLNACLGSVALSLIVQSVLDGI